MKTETSSATPPAFDPGRYPRTYVFSAPSRWTMVVLASGLFVFVGALIESRSARSGHDDLIAEILLLGGLAASAVWMVAAGLRTRAVLSEGRLDYRGAFLSRSVLVPDVLGRRRAPGQTKGIQFDLRPGRGRRLRIRGDLKRDEWFESWLARIPDLDAAERMASLAVVLEDRTLGATPDDVAVRLKRAVLLGRIGTGLAVVLLWELQFGPAWWSTQVDIAITLTLGLAALLSVVLLRGLVSLVPTRHDARPSALFMIATPMLVLPFRLYVQTNLHDGRMLAIGATALAFLGIATALPMVSNPRRRALAALGACACVLAFAVTAIAWLNVWLDRHPVQPVHVAVTARSIGKGPVWQIVIAGTDAVPPGRVVFVSHADHSELQAGDVACLSQHPGLFGLRWAEVHPCAGAASRGGAS